MVDMNVGEKTAFTFVRKQDEDDLSECVISPSDLVDERSTGWGIRLIRNDPDFGIKQLEAIGRIRQIGEGVSQTCRKFFKLFLGGKWVRKLKDTVSVFEKDVLKNDVSGFFKPRVVESRSWIML